MKFYYLKSSYENSKQVMLTNEVEKKLHLKEEMTFDHLWQRKEVININLINVNRDSESLLDFCDTHNWGHQLMLDMVPPPSANIVVISPKLKVILEQFRIPQHSFYECLVTKGIARNTDLQSHRFYKINVDFDEKRQYYILQIKNMTISELWFEQCQFGIFEDKESGQVIKTFNKGQISNEEEFKRINIDALLNENILTPDAYIYRQPYDIVCANSSILVDERVKKAIEEADLTGVALEEFTEYEIITGHQEA